MATLNMKISPKELEQIREWVEKGYALNTSDFVRQAVREKVSVLKITETNA